MIITMSDYLLEQEISTASCDDIVLEQAIAEFEVSCAIIEAYTKQFMMLEYGNEFYQEKADDDDDDEKPGFFKKIKEGFKHLVDSIWTFLKNVWGRFMAFLNSGKNKVLNKKLQKMLNDDSEKLANFSVSLPEAAVRNIAIEKVSEYTNKFIELVNDRELDPSKYASLTSDLNTILNDWKDLADYVKANPEHTVSGNPENFGTGTKLSSGDSAYEGSFRAKIVTISGRNAATRMLRWTEDIENLRQNADLRNIMKTLNDKAVIEEFKEAFGEGEDKDFKRIIKEIKNCGKEIMNLSIAFANTLQRIVDLSAKAAERAEKQRAKREKAEEKEAARAAKADGKPPKSAKYQDDVDKL